MQASNYMKIGIASATVSSSPRKNAMPVEYRSDGTGRDSYIVCNSGGLQTPFNKTCGDRFFKDSLRFSEKPLFKSQRNGRLNKFIAQPFQVDITQYRNWITPKQQLKILNMAKA